MRVKSKHVKPAHSPVEAHPSPPSHSSFFFIWELITGTCVMFVGLVIIVVPSLHLEEAALHEIERWTVTAEYILIVEVALLLLVARNKVHFIKTKWATILAVLPLGASFRMVRIGKVGWHAFEKTHAGHFLRHPIRNSRRWVHVKLGLRI